VLDSFLFSAPALHFPAGAGSQQQQQQQRHTAEEADDAQLQQLADELAQLPHSNGRQDAAAAADADIQQQQQHQALVSPEAFPWEDMLDSINTLVHKGREAGWLAQPSEVRSTTRCTAYALRRCTHLISSSCMSTGYQRFPGDHVTAAKAQLDSAPSGQALQLLHAYCKVHQLLYEVLMKTSLQCT
jgi:hypothetical protein